MAKKMFIDIEPTKIVLLIWINKNGQKKKLRTNETNLNGQRRKTCCYQTRLRNYQ